MFSFCTVLKRCLLMLKVILRAVVCGTVKVPVYCVILRSVSNIYSAFIDLNGVDKGSIDV